MNFRNFQIIQVPLLFGVLIGCSPKPLATKPTSDEVVGEYIANLPEKSGISKVTIRTNGTLTALQIPERGIPGRGSGTTTYHNIEGSWRLTNNSPGGEWCVNFEGIYLRAYQKNGRILFVYPYDVQNRYTAVYCKR